jgi:protein-L-isoaspartate(D-aspartate) O-methyltransferase
MAHLAGSDGRVVTIDIDADIVANARQHLDRTGYPNVTTICADGAVGYAAGGPYDRIVAAVAAADITPAWSAQLKPDGVIVVPLVVRGPQKSIAFARRGDVLHSREIVDCHYIRLRGECGGWLQDTTWGCSRGIVVTTERTAVPSAAMLEQAFTGPATTMSTGVNASLPELHSDLSLWLALQNASFCTIKISEGPSCSQALDLVFGETSFRPLRTMGVLGADGLCLLAASPAGDLQTFHLTVRLFGRAHALAESLVAQIAAWHERGRPSSRTLCVTAHSRGAAHSLAAGQFAVAKPWHTYVFGWDH